MKKTVRNHKEMGEYCDSLMQVSFEKGPFIMEHNRKKDARTLSQNSLYHWWVDIIAKDNGENHDDMGQNLMKHMIPPTHESKNLDGVMEPRWSTTELNVIQMKDYMDKVLIWATGEGIFLPLPSDQHAR